MNSVPHAFHRRQGNDRGRKHSNPYVRRCTLAVCLMTIIAACQGSGEQGSTPTGVEENHPLAVFPSDRFTTIDSNTYTGLRVQLPENAETDPLFAAFPELVAELESLDGFGTAAPLWVQLNGLLDPATLPTPAASTAPTAAVRLIDLEKEVPVPFTTTWQANGQTLFIHPLQPLREKRRYALVLAEPLRDSRGRPLRPSNGDWQITRVPSELLPEKPILVNTFTTQSITQTMAALARQERTHGPAEFPEAADLCPGGSVDHIGWMGTGHMQSTDLRTEDDRFPMEVDHRDAVEPDAIPTTVPYRIFIPAGAKGAATVIVQHGLANIKERALTCHVADAYAEEGLATIAIDAVWHGERGPDQQPPPIMDNLRTLFGLWTDGHRFTAHIRQGRDAMRQTAYDHFHVASLIQTFAEELDRVHADGSAAPDGVFDLSGRLLYNGASMGGIIGSVTVAAHPDMEAAVLNVPGGRLSSFLYESRLHFYDLLLQPLMAANTGLSHGDVHRFLAVFQAVWDRADAINHAHRWWLDPAEDALPRSVLVQETLDDVIVPNASTRALARSGGLPLLTPALHIPDSMDSTEIPPDGLQSNLGPGVTGGWVQFQDVHLHGEPQRATHGTITHDEVLRQSVGFLSTAISEPAPVIQRGK